MNEQALADLIKRHDLGVPGADVLIMDNHGDVVIEMPGLPQLGFFVELAALTGVPIESIRVRCDDGGPGCSTCGYGGGPSFFVTFTPPAETAPGPGE